MRAAVLVLPLLLVPQHVAAEWQIKPFLGVTFAGSTTFVDPERAAGGPNIIYGSSAMLLGQVFGIEGDFGFAPGFFDAGDRELVTGSSVMTFTGNLVIALPRRLTEYTLRPYFAGGAGLIRVRSNNPLQVKATLPAVDVGGGVTGFLTDRVGIGWDVRRFFSIDGNEGRGISIGEEQISFWRATMALALRY
jgi:hypothetical protein